MVSHSRTSLRADQLRPLNAPQPLQVVCNKHGRLVEVRWRKRRERVVAIKDCWRIEDEWWRQPIRRTYYLVELEISGLFTLYYDHEDGSWYRQWEVPLVSLMPWSDDHRVR